MGYSWPVDLAYRFRDLREQAGLTKTDLARPRYTVSYVSQIEAGRRKPSPQALAFFADKLGVTPEYLATGVPEGIEDSLRYQLEEARRAIREGKGEEAERLLNPVLSQAEQYGLTRLHALALAAKGDALALMGQMREAIDAFEEAMDGDLPIREAGVTVASLGRAYRAVGDLTYAAEVIEAYLGQRDRGPLDPAVVADLQSILVSVYFERGDVLRAERAAKRALQAADEHVPSEIRAHAYWDASRVLAEAKRWDEALDLATRARIILEQFDDRRRVGLLHAAYAYICLDAEPPRTDEAREHLDRASDFLGGESSAPGELIYVFTQRCRLAILEERYEEALAFAEQALQQPPADELETAEALFLKGRVLGALGGRGEATVALKRAAVLFGRQGARRQEAACWRELGELDLAAGDMEAALAALRAGLQALDPRRSRA